MKTTKEIQQLRKVLQHEFDNLPQVNALGHSNKDDHDRLFSWIKELNYLEKHAETSDPNSDISLWYRDECLNQLCHYDTMLDEFQEYEEILKLASTL